MITDNCVIVKYNSQIHINLYLLCINCENIIHKMIILCYTVFMLKTDLIATGLNPTQAEVYVHLIKYGSAPPTHIAKELKITRSNAYKVLDQLCDLKLAKRQEVKKKLTYYPDNPLGLTNLVAQQRNLATVQEEAVKKVMGDLLASYHKNKEQPDVRVVTGRQAVIDAYFDQIKQLKPIYFIRSPADIATMSFDTMHTIRSEPARFGIDRYGITPDKGATSSVSADKRTNLSRTWISQEDYDFPVEWSVSGSTLLIVLFGAEPHSITITNPAIAGAFKQLFILLSNLLKTVDGYENLPRKS